MASRVGSGLDYYAVLGIHLSASTDEVIAAHRRLAKLWHPDLHPGDPRAHERMRVINEARDVLADPDRRREYDRQAALNDRGDRGVRGVHPASASPAAIDFGEVGAGESSPVVEVSIRMRPQPAAVAPKRDRGTFWSLAEDAFYVPHEDELAHPDEFLRIRVHAILAPDVDRTAYTDKLIIELDSELLTIPLSIRVGTRTEASATSPPGASGAPGGTGTSTPASGPATRRGSSRPGASGAPGGPGTSTPRPSPSRGRGPFHLGAIVGGILILAVTLIVVLSATSHQAPTSPPIPPGLPVTVASDLTVRPALLPAVGRVHDGSSGITLTSSAKQFEFKIAMSDPGGGLANFRSSAPQIDPPCVQVLPNPGRNTSAVLVELPITWKYNVEETATGLSDTAVGSVAALVPGYYYANFESTCDGVGPPQLFIGRVTTPITSWTGDLPFGVPSDGFVVFSANRSRSQRVIQFGIVYTGGRSLDLKRSCLTSSPTAAEGVAPSKIKLVTHTVRLKGFYGDGVSPSEYTVGVLTFDGARAVTASTFLPNCADTGYWQWISLAGH